MPIQQITTDTTGQIGVNPRIVKIVCNDSLYTVTSEGYLNAANKGGYPIFETDLILIYYLTGVGFFRPIFSDGNITLITESADIDLPTILNNIAVFSNTEGGLKNGAATAINPGNLQAGLSGTAGVLRSYPATEAKGYLEVKATANSGDTVFTLTNAAMGQATTVTIPDPGASAANALVYAGALTTNSILKSSGTAGKMITAGKAVRTTDAGGSATITVTDTDVTSSHCIFAAFQASANAVTIQKVTAGSGSFTILCSGDPGASTINYLALLP